MESKIIVPSLGESVIEATVLHWLKQAGEPVRAGEALVELETDKVNLEVAAEKDGILARIEQPEGQDVRIGDVLGVIETSNGNGAQPQAGPFKAQEKPEQPVPEQPQVPERVEDKLSSPKEEKVSPVARRFAEENEIDLSKVEGSGPQGWITRQDVEAWAQSHRPEEKTAAPAMVQPAVQAPDTEKNRPQEKTAQPAAPSPVSQPKTAPETPRSSGERSEERIRMSRRRRTIAQNLLQAQQGAALLTTFNDVDMTAVMEMRKARKEAFKEKYGASLGIVSFFVKASILALKDFPQINAEIQGDEMVIKHYYDIGVAIGAEEGLVVPVLRDADRMTFGQIEQGIQSFSAKVKDGTLSLADLQGGTFTITNGGVFGSMLSTPIVNAPQVGILGLHRIEERPVARNGQVVIRPMMYLALTYDHRIVDGREAVKFLVRIKQAIESPDLMLLDL